MMVVINPNKGEKFEKLESQLLEPGSGGGDGGIGNVIGSFNNINSNDDNEDEDCDSRGMLKLNQELVVNKGNLYNYYRMDKGAPFATGLYAQVKRCKSLRPHPGNYYAAKFSPRKRPGQAKDEECVENLHEIALLSRLKNPYIISFEDAFILEDCVVTIMEFAPGGDLQSIIDADLVLLEKDASRYIYQLLDALKYLHQKHIAHLDIKPQNLLLMGEFPSCNIKLCDFEISRVIKPGKEIKEILGTPDYVAPEILLYEPLSTAADIWSVGILCYVLLTGFSPFGGDTDQETFSNIIHEPIDFPDELFEDVSPDAIDFIVRVAVKNAKSRPTAMEMLEHEWVKSFRPPVIVNTVEPDNTEQNINMSSVNHSGPKKRSPRKTMALSGSSTASAAAGRRPSARAILRACKSAYDLNKMGGKTKSREALVEKMKIASGEPSVGGNWKLRKNLSKSREQLWESKIQLSKSCEKINNNLPGSTRWASVANFPSLDLGTMKSSTSQESVISVMSTCTNIGTAAQQQELLDWQQQSLDDFVCPTPHPYSISMPNTPPIPNFDLSSPVNNINMIHESTAPSVMNMNYNALSVAGSLADFNYPSLMVNGGSNATGGESVTIINDSSAIVHSSGTATVEQESQKSVAELIMTFGGRVSGPNGKKLDLKNQFEPILEVDGSEEQPMSLGDCSDNNSTSGVSSIIASSTATTPTAKDAKDKMAELKNESGNYSMTSYSSIETNAMTEIKIPKEIKSLIDAEGSSSRSSSRRSSKTSQQIREEMRNKGSKANTGSDVQYSSRRGSTSPPKTCESSSGLKGILKKPSTQYHVSSPSSVMNNANANKAVESSTATTGIVANPVTTAITSGTANLGPPGPNGSRRGSIPGNCTRLYDTHTISSLAKVPAKRSILKSAQSTDTKSSSISGCKIAPEIKKGPERSSSKSPENISPKESPVPPVAGNNKEPEVPPPAPTTATETPKVKVIPKGLSPRERPSFIFLGGVGSDSKSSHRTFSPSPTRRSTTKTPSTTPVTGQTKRKMTKSLESSFDETETNVKNNTNLQPTPQPPPPPPPPLPKQLLTGSGIKNSKFKSEISVEPAAVAIKVFPPDPIIIPKSSILLLKSGQSPEPCNNNINSNNILDDNGNINMNNNNNNSSSNNDVHINNKINDTKTSPETRRKSKGNHGVVKRGEKPTWGIVCTGSVGRAMNRFENGQIKGKKLRRGSVPDF